MSNSTNLPKEAAKVPLLNDISLQQPKRDLQTIGHSSHTIDVGSLAKDCSLQQENTSQFNNPPSQEVTKEPLVEKISSESFVHDMQLSNSALKQVIQESSNSDLPTQQSKKALKSEASSSLHAIQVAQSDPPPSYQVAKEPLLLSSSQQVLEIQPQPQGANDCSNCHPCDNNTYRPQPEPKVIHAKEPAPKVIYVKEEKSRSKSEDVDDYLSIFLCCCLCFQTCAEE